TGEDQEARAGQFPADWDHRGRGRRASVAAARPAAPLKERSYLRVAGTRGVRVRSATVSEQAGQWPGSLQAEQDPDQEQDQDREQDREQGVAANTSPVVGVHLGVKSLAALSDGTLIPNPRHLKHHSGNSTPPIARSAASAWAAGSGR